MPVPFHYLKWTDAILVMLFKRINWSYIVISTIVSPKRLYQKPTKNLYFILNFHNQSPKCNARMFYFIWLILKLQYDYFHKHRNCKLNRKFFQTVHVHLLMFENHLLYIMQLYCANVRHHTVLVSPQKLEITSCFC